jgi:excisionase family DNA binding protein
MSPIDKLRALVENAPKGTLVPVESLAEMLKNAERIPVADEQASEPAGDLTVQYIAKRLGRSSSTIRGWLAAAEIPEAYKLLGREWRVPRAALQHFLDRQREAAEPLPAANRLADANLQAWRKEYPDAA